MECPCPLDSIPSHQHVPSSWYKMKAPKGELGAARCVAGPSPQRLWQEGSPQQHKTVVLLMHLLREHCFLIWIYWTYTLLLAQFRPTRLGLAWSFHHKHTHHCTRKSCWKEVEIQIKTSSSSNGHGLKIVSPSTWIKTFRKIISPFFPCTIFMAVNTQEATISHTSVTASSKLFHIDVSAVSNLKLQLYSPLFHNTAIASTNVKE